MNEKFRYIEFVVENDRVVRTVETQIFYKLKSHFHSDQIIEALYTQGAIPDHVNPLHVEVDFVRNKDFIYVYEVNTPLFGLVKS